MYVPSLIPLRRSTLLVFKAVYPFIFQDNVYVEEIDEEPGNYALVLEAKDETVGTNAFTSGKVTTENKVAIKYGVVEVFCDCC